jgi:hypothetical protein
VVETVLDGVWLLAHILTLLALGDGGGLLGLALLLLGLGLWAVLAEKLEGLSGLVAVEASMMLERSYFESSLPSGNIHILELSERRWDLQTELEDLLLALKANILGPLDETAQVWRLSAPCPFMAEIVNTYCALAGCPGQCRSCEDASQGEGSGHVISIHRACIPQ